MKEKNNKKNLLLFIVGRHQVYEIMLINIIMNAFLERSDQPILTLKMQEVLKGILETKLKGYKICHLNTLTV